MTLTEADQTRRVAEAERRVAEANRRVANCTPPNAEPKKLPKAERRAAEAEQRAAEAERHANASVATRPIIARPSQPKPITAPAPSRPSGILQRKSRSCPPGRGPSSAR